MVSTWVAICLACLALCTASSCDCARCFSSSCAIFSASATSFSACTTRSWFPQGKGQREQLKCEHALLFSSRLAKAYALTFSSFWRMMSCEHTKQKKNVSREMIDVSIHYIVVSLTGQGLFDLSHEWTCWRRFMLFVNYAGWLRAVLRWSGRLVVRISCIAEMYEQPCMYRCILAWDTDGQGM